MMALIAPTAHSSERCSAGDFGVVPSVVPSMLKARGKERLAPLLPVWSQPWVAAPMAHSAIEYQSMTGPCHLWSLSYKSARCSSSLSSSSISNRSGSRATSAARPNRAACSDNSCDSAQAWASAAAFSRENRYSNRANVSIQALVKTARSGKRDGDEWLYLQRILDDVEGHRFATTSWIGEFRSSSSLLIGKYIANRLLLGHDGAGAMC